MDFKKIALVVLINFVIAFGFFYGNLDANATDISSDLANIIPICKKLDNPALYQKDMYLSDINDVKYYTPFYVESLRMLAKLTHHDYIQALNLLSFIIHFVYGMLWFAFFYTLRRDFVLALVFSVFFRGILWPPGGELLGISDLWTAMPRTLFIALAPLPFLLYVHLKRFKMPISALVLGLILNFHPISGVGMVVCYAAVFVWNAYFSGNFGKRFYKDFLLGIACCLLGMVPYLATYLANIGTDLQFNESLFELAFAKRLDDSFIDPLLFIPQWNRPILIFLAILFCVYFFFDPSEKKRNFKILAGTMLLLFVSANSFTYIENGVNALLHKNLRMAFQLIRIQKFILVLLQIGLFLLLVALLQRFAVRESYKWIGAVGFFLVVAMSSLPGFSKIPLVGDDLVTSIYPTTLKFGPKWESQNKKDKWEMVGYIARETPKDALFFGDCVIRAGADRSVILDAKGAGMLIEGNRNKFIQWYLDTEKLEHLPPSGRIAFLQSKKVDYIMSDTVWSMLKPEKHIGKFHLYKLQMPQP